MFGVHFDENFAWFQVCAFLGSLFAIPSTPLKQIGWDPEVSFHLLLPWSEIVAIDRFGLYQGIPSHLGLR